MIEFFGYRLKNGEVKTRRFFSMEDITEAEESPFVEKTTNVIEAENIEEAKVKIYNLLNPTN